MGVAGAKSRGWGVGGGGGFKGILGHPSVFQQMRIKLMQGLFGAL